MAPQAEMRRNGTVRREKALGMSWGVTPLWAPFSLSRPLARVLSPIVQSAVRPLLDAKQDLPLGSTVALELIRDPRLAVRQGTRGPKYRSS
jgi:hypothetical protein